MKKIVPILFLGVMLFFQNGLAQDLNYIQVNYQKAATDKSVCQSLIENLSNEEASNLELAYLCALETIWAKHTDNPFSKLSTFNSGKGKIEKAAKNAPNNIQISYL